MNVERLLAVYDRVNESSDAVSRLRRFVLDLAVRGKLVEQDPADEPASELLNRIAAAKAMLVKAGTVNRRKSTESEPPNDVGFELQSGWEISRLSDVVIELRTGPFGSSLHQKDYEIGGTPVINPASIQHGEIVPIEKMAVGENTLDRLSTFKLKAGDIVMGRRGEMGRCAVVTEHEDGWLCGTGSLILRLPEDLCPEYLAILISSPYVREYLARFSVGATMRNLNQSILLRMSIAVPPKGEQHRIVAKIDELIALCDRLEQARTARDDTRDRLSKASYARLSALGTDDEAFRAHARFSIDTFPALTAHVDQIKHLRQIILNLAIRGKLVEQDSDDEPASELLNRVKEEKARLVRTKVIGRQRTFPLLEELPFAVPEQWRWTRMREITSDRGQRVPDVAFTYIDVTAIDKESGLVVSPKIVKLGEAPSRARKVVQQGDVIYSCVRPYLLNVAIIEDEFDPAPIASTAFAILNGHGVVLPRYLWVVLRSPFMVECVKQNQRGQAYPAINDTDFAALPLPLPPLAEQHRIVAKVDGLMTLCELLESKLNFANTGRQRLLESLLRDVLDPSSDLCRVRRP